MLFRPEIRSVHVSFRVLKNGKLSRALCKRRQICISLNWIYPRYRRRCQISQNRLGDYSNLNGIKSLSLESLRPWKEHISDSIFFYKKESFSCYKIRVASTRRPLLTFLMDEYHRQHLAVLITTCFDCFCECGRALRWFLEKNTTHVTVASLLIKHPTW